MSLSEDFNGSHAPKTEWTSFEIAGANPTIKSYNASAVKKLQRHE
jgi:hypothetical protein